MYDIKLGNACGVKLTLLTPSGAVCDLRKARKIWASLILPSGATMTCENTSYDTVTNTIYVKLLPDMELTATGVYGIVVNVYLADNRTYSTAVAHIVEVKAGAERQFVEIVLGLSLTVVEFPSNASATGASPQISTGGTWLIYDDAVKAYRDSGILAGVVGIINITGRVADIFPLTATLDAAVPNANVSVSIEDYRIGTVVADNDGNFSLQWRISEGEYDDLIATYGPAMQMVVQKDGYLTSEIQVDIPTDHQSVVQQGVSANVQLLMEGDMRVTEVPVGFNISGKRTYFTNRFKPMDSAIFTNGGRLFGVSANWGDFGIWALPADGTNPDIIRMIIQPGLIFPIIWRGDSEEWVVPAQAFPSGMGSAIVSENTLEANSDELWSWNDVIITDRTP